MLGNKNGLGCKHSPEAIERSRIATIKRWQDPGYRKAHSGENHHMKNLETAKRISALRVGKPFSEEHRKNLSKALLGRRRSEESMIKQSLAISRENHWNWRGGLSNYPYPFEFNEELKERIRERDNHTCQLCGIHQVECIMALDVHHIDYDKENLADENLITLCRGCNSKVNINRDYWQEYFQEIVQSYVD